MYQVIILTNAHSLKHCLCRYATKLGSLTALTLNYLPGTGVKINQVDTLTSRGYDRDRISSRAIEAYLIQVLNLVSFCLKLDLMLDVEYNHLIGSLEL